MKEREDRKAYVSPQVTTLEANDLIEVLGPASAGIYAAPSGTRPTDDPYGDVGPLPNFL